MYFINCVIATVTTMALAWAVVSIVLVAYGVLTHQPSEVVDQ